MTVGRPFYRHSRVSGNPERYRKDPPVAGKDSWIPAYAGMTVWDGNSGRERRE